MNTGAIITVPSASSVSQTGGENWPVRDLSRALADSPFTSHEILGRTLLQHTEQVLFSFGISNRSVLFEETESQNLFVSRTAASGGLYSAWENAVSQQLQNGVEYLLLVRLGAYVELDYANLLRFHIESANSLTQVYDHKGAFEVAVLSAKQLQNPQQSFRASLRSLIPYHGRYIFRGYSNQMRGPDDFRQLVRDALLRRNSIRPAGTQIDKDIWLGKGARVDSTATLSGPVYIGAGTEVLGACTINGASAIERNCKIDFGTTISDSCVLPETYVGVGLNVANSIAAPGQLFNLRRNVKVDVTDRKLVGRHAATTKFGLAKKMRRNQNLPRVSRKRFQNGPHLVSLDV